jgi:hypothetical protein
MGTKISHRRLVACYSAPWMAPNRLMLLALATCVFPALAAWGCGTDANGVSECREIEFVRCEAGAYCGQFRNVSACRRFHRDHCLHGLGVSEISAVQVDACVTAIRNAGECARFWGPGAEPDQCSTNIALASSADLICEVIVEPERAQACSFLVEESSTPAPTPTSQADGGAD